MKTMMMYGGAAAAVVMMAGAAQAKTFSFPHVLETSGRIAVLNPPFSFDTTIFALTDLQFEDSPNADGSTTYAKKHIGNVKYEEISSAAGKADLEVLISDILETQEGGGYRTAFTVKFTGIITDGTTVVPVESTELSVFGFDPVPLNAEARMAYTATLPGFNLFIAGTNTVAVEIDAGGAFTLAPAPGAAAIVGLAGLVASRRRR